MNKAKLRRQERVAERLQAKIAGQERVLAASYPDQRGALQGYIADLKRQLEDVMRGINRMRRFDAPAGFIEGTQVCHPRPLPSEVKTRERV